MKRSICLLVLLTIGQALGGCGGARPVRESTRDSRDVGSRRAPRGGSVEAGDDEGDERSGRRGAIDPAIDAERRELADFPLDPRIAVPGTGVSIEAPRGSQRSASGSTLVHTRRRIQVVVAAAEGDLSVHQQFRSGLRGDAEEISSEEIQLGEHPATLIVDHMTQGDTELERVWVIVRVGTRSAAAMGVYSVDRAEVLRDYLKASVRTMQVDPASPIDPEAALGWRLDTGDSLRLVRAASTNVSYSQDGEPPANVGAPMMLLMPLPISVPEAQRAELCPQILAQLVQLGSEATPTMISEGEMIGCDQSAITSDEASLQTYTALVFRDEAAFLVVGSVTSAPRSPWVERFRTAARSIQPVAN